MLDALFQHLKDELSMQGEEGATLADLSRFIADFYARKARHVQQTLDSDYTAFIWSRLVRIRQVRIGYLDPLHVPDEPETNTLPDGEYDFVELDKAVLDNKSAQELEAIYGDRLRIGVDQETCWFSITGSHNRPTKLTNIVYAILKSIARGREDGRTAIELGQEFPYDQKSIFHFVKSLLSLDLVVKFRTKAKGAATNRILHKRYLDTSPHWQAFTANDTNTIAVPPAQADNEADEEPISRYPPITPMHLHSNPQLVRARIIKVLKESEAHTLPHQAIIYAINLTPTLTSERRKLNRLIDIMAEEGILLKGVAPSKSGNAMVVQLLKTDEEQQSLAPDAEMEEDREMEDASASRSDDALFDIEPLDLSRLRYTLPPERQVLDVIQNSGDVGSIQNDIVANLKGVEKRSVETILAALERTKLPPHLSDNKIYAMLENAGRVKRVRYFSVQGYAARCQKDEVAPPHDLFAGVDLVQAGRFAAIETHRFASSLAQHDQHILKVVAEKHNPRGRPKKVMAGTKTKPKEEDPDAPPKERKGKGKAASTAPQEQGEDAVVDLGEGPSGACSSATFASYATPEPTADPELSLEMVKKPGKKGRPKKQPGEPRSPYVRKLTPDGKLANPRKGESEKSTSAAKRKRSMLSTVEDGELEPPLKRRSGGRPRKNHLPELSSEPASDEDELLSAPKAMQSVQLVRLGNPDPTPEPMPVASTSAMQVDELASEPVVEMSPPPPSAQLAKRGRGRPRKHPLPTLAVSASETQVKEPAMEPVVEVSVPLAQPAKRGRGRPRKQPLPTPSVSAPPPAPVSVPLKDPASAAPPSAPPAKRGRGRPRKHPLTTPSPVPVAIAPEEPVSGPSEPAPASKMPTAALTLDTTAKAVQQAHPPSSAGPAAVPSTAEELLVTPMEVDEPVKPVDQLVEPAAPLAERQNSNSRAVASAAPLRVRSATSFAAGRPNRKSHSANVRENEIYTALQISNGVLEDTLPSITKVQQQVQRKNEGLAPDAYVPLLDKRTLTRALNGLEERGLIKRTSINAPSVHGTMRMVKILHLPEISINSDQVKQLLANLPMLNRTGNDIPLLEGVNLNNMENHPRIRTKSGEWTDAQIEEYCRTEWRVAAQYFGYLWGRFARARALYKALYKQTHSSEAFAKIEARLSTGEQVKVFTTSVLFHDITLGEYVQIVPISGYTEDLEEYFRDPSQLEVKISQVAEARPDLVPHLSLSGPKYRRARTTLNAPLFILASLGLIIPLHRCSVEEADCIIKPVDLTLASVALKRFDPQRLQPEYSDSEVQLADAWIFSDRVPVWTYDTSSPRFEGMLDVTPEQNSDALWSHLEEIASAKNPLNWHELPLLPVSPLDNVPATCPVPEATLKDFRKKVRWWTFCFLLQHKQFLDAKRPLVLSLADDPVAYNAEIDRLAKLLLVDSAQVHDYLKHNHRKRKHKYDQPHSSRKAQRKRSKKNGEDLDEGADADAAVDVPQIQKVLARKARELEAQRHADWNALLSRCSTRLQFQFAPSAELEDLENLFKTGSMPESRLMQELTSLKAAQTQHGLLDPSLRLASNRSMFRPSRAAPEPVHFSTEEVAVAPAQKSRALRTGQHGAVIRQEPFSRKELLAQAGGTVENNVGAEGAQTAPIITDEPQEKPTGPRSRHKWTVEEDDLLRDFHVIMRVKSLLSKGNSPTPWKLLADSGLLHTKSASHIRLHFINMSRDNQAWTNALVETWKQKYLELIDDETFIFPHGDDLKDWIDLMRSQVYTGYININENSGQAVDLPAEISEIKKLFTVRSGTAQAAEDISNRWKRIITDGVSTVLREKDMAQLACVFPAPPARSHAADPAFEVAQGAIKSLIGTRADVYEATTAHEVLEHINQATLTAAINRLHKSLVIVRVQSGEDRVVPGRNYTFSDKWTKAFNGQLPLANVSRAQAFIEAKSEQVSLAPEEGDLLAFLSLVSDDKVECSIDLSLNADKRDYQDYQTRKLDDEAIENTVVCSVQPYERTEVTRALGIRQTHLSKFTLDALDAALEEVGSDFDAELVRAVFEAASEKGPKGIPVHDLYNLAPASEIDRLIDRFGACEHPALLHVGFDHPTVVSNVHFEQWALRHSGERDSYFVPRQWLDIRGVLLPEVALQSCQAVMSAIHQHAGPDTVQLQGLLAPLFSLVELRELLGHLRTLGLVERTADKHGWIATGASWLFMY